MTLYSTPFWLPWLYPDFVWKIKTEEPVIYLSFDDGPVPGPTDFVLDTLRQFNAKATFFCVGGNVVKYNSIFKELVAQGHAYGNHTQHHINGWNSATTLYVDNFSKCQEQMPEASLFRPPYGRITRRQASVIKQTHKIVMWDVLSRDYQQSISPEDCLKNTIRASRRGSIVVFHDSYKAETNLRYTLPRYLEHFAGKGYKFLSL